MSATPRQRYENIDALRAIAAILVVIQHFFGDVVREAQNPDGPLVGLFRASLESVDLGRLGVVLFFLISGFVVPFSIRGAQPLRRFAISRFFRLYPALWLAVFALAAWFSYRGEPVPLATVLANMTMFPSIIGFPWLSGIYWTLTVELIFYVLSAGLFWLGVLYRPKIVAAFALLLVASTALPIFARMAGIGGLPVQYLGLHVSFLYCGLLLRMAMIEKKPGAWAGAALVAAAQFAVLPIIGDFSLARGDRFFLIATFPNIIAYLIAFLLFILAVRSGRPQSRLLSFGGAISYSIYLFHGVAALLVYSVMPLTGGWSDLVTGLFSLLLALLISWVVFTCLETPMIALGRRIASPPPPAAAPTS